GEVGAPQVARAGSRTVGGVRDPDPFPEQGELFGRLVEARGQTSRVEEAPEVVARIREVRAGGGGHAPRVDADEDDAEIASEDVGHVARRRLGFTDFGCVSHLFPHGGSEPPFVNGRGRGVTRRWQLRAERSARGYAASAAASAASSSAMSSSVRASMRASNSRRRSSPDTADSYRGRRGSIFTRVTVESQPPYKRT